MKLLSFSNVKLLDGSWVGALDILRKKLLSRCLIRECVVSLYDLQGGEFRKKIELGYKLFDEERVVVAEAQDYVSGGRLLNPLRDE